MSEKFTKKAGAGAGEGGGLFFVKPADLSRAEFEGIVAEGEFVEALPNQFNDNISDFKIVLDTPLKVMGVDKDGDRYEKELATGDTVVVNGAGNLNYLMKEVSPGSLCQIAYNGKIEITKGNFKGKEAHNFNVQYEG
jgi:hypothetical protein